MGSLHRWAVHDTTSVQADQDLYADFGLDSGELPSRQASLSGTRPAAVASEALEVPVASIAAFEAPAEAPSSAHDGTIKEERPVAPVAPLDSGLSAEGALQAIANALQLEESRRAPAHIAAAAQVQIQQADSAKHLLEEERKKQVAHEVQLADMTVELLEAERRVSEAEAAAQPEFVHLRALHTDPAIAREFAELRAAARKLAEEKKILTDTVQGLAFKAGDQRGKQLMTKLQRAEAETKALERQLQQHDAALAQLALVKAQLREVTGAYNAAKAECEALRAQGEGFVSHIVSLKKSNGRAGAYEVSGASGAQPPPPPRRAAAPQSYTSTAHRAGAPAAAHRYGGSAGGFVGGARPAATGSRRGVSPTPARESGGFLHEKRAMSGRDYDDRPSGRLRRM